MSFKRLTKRSLTLEMERNVKQMLKLIEEDGDSFAQKAEMYYQKRPELISLVEEFYRGYKSLAERYDHDLQSQASCFSDNGSDPPSTWPSPSPRKMGMRRVSSNRAAGFDFFLGSSGGGNNNGYYDACQKDGDGSSTLTDSDDESDASSIHSYNSGFFGGGGGGGCGGDHGMNRRIMELEMELRGVKEKLCMHEEEHGGSCNNKGTRMIESNKGEDVRAKVNAYEQELRNVNEKLRLSEEEIAKLKVELEKYRSLELVNLHASVESSSSEEGIKNERGEALDLKTLEKESNWSLGEELRVTKEKLESSKMQTASLRLEASKSSESIQQLQDQLNLAMKEIAAWKTKFNSEKRESTKFQERLGRLKTNLAERDNAELAISLEKAQLKSEMSRLLEAKTHLEEKIRGWECHGQSLEEEIRKIQSEKLEMEQTLKGEIEMLKEDIKERNNNIEDLNASLDALKLERDNLNAEVDSLKEVVNSKDNQIVQLVEENERQRAEILEGAEEKREAIRQLCFSLEHYRNGYNVLRQAFIGHKRFPILAS